MWGGGGGFAKRGHEVIWFQRYLELESLRMFLALNGRKQWSLVVLELEGPPL